MKSFHFIFIIFYNNAKNYFLLLKIKTTEIKVDLKIYSCFEKLLTPNKDF